MLINSLIMPNNLFYKTLSIIGTLGIVVLSSTQVLTALKKNNNTVDEQLAKTIIEIKNARKEALAEIKSLESDTLKELKFIQSNTINVLEKDNANSLFKIEKAQQSALNEINIFQKKVLSELKAMSPKDHSDSWWLILVARNGGIWDGSQTSAAWTLPMKGENECQAAGLKVQGDKSFHGKVYQHMRYTCVKGK